MVLTRLAGIMILLAILTVAQATVDIYYVKPSHNSSLPYSCPSSYPCHTLQYYVRNKTALFKSNSTLKFLPGIHILESNEANKPTTIENVHNLKLIGNDTFVNNTMLVPSSQIHCNGSGGLLFTAVHGLFIGNLLFSRCGAVLPWPFDGRFRAALAIGNTLPQESIFDVNITRVVIQNSTGYGLYGSNVFGNSAISESTFIYNNYNGSQEYFGGNVRVSYHNWFKNAGNSTFTIQSSYFLHGRNPNDYRRKGNTNSTSAGLGITVMGLGCSSIVFNIINITARDNVGVRGGNIEIQYLSNNITASFYIIRCLLEDGVVTRDMYGGGGLEIQSEIGTEAAGGHSSSSCNIVHKHHFVTVVNTTFVHNKGQGGGALSIEHVGENIVCVNRIVMFENCVFTNNTSVNGFGEAVYISGRISKGVKFIYDETFSFRLSSQHMNVFNNCTFSNSAITNKKSLSETENAVVVLLSAAKNVVFTDCTFVDNIGTAISAVQSNVIFEGNITFRNNTGINGGALFFCEDSAMFLRNDTSIHFIDNHALHSGGAIYAQDQCLTDPYKCFFLYESLQTIHLQFENNTANYAGNVLYGGIMDEKYCPFDNLTDVHNTNFNRSEISSDPTGVTFCSDNDALEYETKEIEMFVYPGEDFHLSATTVGQLNGTVPGDIHATLINPSSSKILSSQESQVIHNSSKCAKLNYTIFSGREFEQLKLVAVRPQLTISTKDNYNHAVINVTLKRCPEGFTLLEGDRGFQCDCSPRLTKVDHGITCNINSQTIHRPPAVWIGYKNTTGPNSTNETGVVLIHPNCPLHYCVPTPNDINLALNPDKQCAFNRSGTLCGACQPGLSLVLGTSACKQCPNDYYLLLLLAFSVAGIALLALLFTCNLTVTEGTIGGLIFYANIIWINRAIFIPPGTMKVLSVFLAWMNLDLGIQTCFYQSMDMYIKTWLQFAFPIYLWAITGLLIFLSSRFAAVSRLLGDKPVQVLSTLFLLAYAKLQRTIIAALSFTYISYPDGKVDYVWLYDANIGYLSPKHIPLFVVALLFLIIFSLPYAFVLTFIKFLRAFSHWKLLSWVNRMKPIFDAYTGPYKDQYPFWTGFLLLTRNILFLIFAFNFTDEPGLNLMSCALASLLILVLMTNLRGIYKKWPLDILESSFHLNLGIVSVATLYTQLTHGNQVAVIYTSTGIATATFTVIMLYHAFQKIRLFRCCDSEHTQYSPLATNSTTPNYNTIPGLNPNPDNLGELDQEGWPPVKRFNQLREPLLEDTQEIAHP